MPRITLYHGSNVKIEQPQIRQSKRTKDFGPGFYCTNIKEQAQRWASRYDTPIVNSYHALINSELKILEFPTMTDAWLDFVVACRAGQTHDYDIVIGAMADDQIYNHIQEFLDGIISREDFWYLVRFRYPTHQINFCTDAALQCLSFRSCEEVVLDA